MQKPKRSQPPKKTVPAREPPLKITPRRPRQGEPEGNLERREAYFRKRRGSI